MKKSFSIVALSLMIISVFGQTKEVVKCRIWKPESFCVLPDSVHVPGAVHYSDAEMRGVSCDQLNSRDLTGIWVTFQGKDVKELNMTGHYDNISLVRLKSGKVLHPVAYMERSKPISEEGNPVYMSNESKIGKCTFELKPNEKYDLFIIFDAAGVGDKLIIKDFLEAKVK